MDANLGERQSCPRPPKDITRINYMLCRHPAVLLFAALIFPIGQRTLAHTCPGNAASGAGMFVTVTALRANGITPIGSGNVTECERIIFRMGVGYLSPDPVTLAPTAAFEGGEMSLTVHGNRFDVTPPGGMPLVGGDGSGDCNGPAFVVSQQLPYVITASDVAAGIVTVLGVYTNGTAHIGESDLPGVVHGSNGFLVRVAPSVSCDTMPAALTAREGSAATFCANGTSGKAPYEFSWTGPAGFFSTNRCISITNVAGLNAGVYRVLVADAAGCTNSCDAVLAVIPSLGISLADGKLTLSWSPDATGFVLEKVDDLSGSWSAADSQGNPYEVVPTRAATFYRLAK